MPDREEVISDIQDIFKYVPLWKVEKTLTDALVLLREREPVKPKTDDAWPYPVKVCGACGTCLFNVGDFKAKFCSECGRAVKWDE